MNEYEFGKKIYEVLIEQIHKIFSESDIDKLLRIAMDIVIEIAGAERGMIILFEQGDNITFKVARQLSKEDIEHPQFQVSQTIIRKVRQSGESICLENALDDPNFQKSESARALKLLSVICIPFKHQDDIFGVVYLDNRKWSGIFKAETMNFIQKIANFISLAAYRALEQKQLFNKIDLLEKELRGKYDFDAIISQHPKMLNLLKLVAQVAGTDATVLIQGESGTGKELIARALHFNSTRKNKPFIPVNCGALPEHLLESELFGHVRGAFTGAIKDKAGWFECSDGGTIFLDEINDMSQELQSRLLRILQTGEYSKLGSTKICKCDIRIIAATNKNLKELVTKGTFREDVYYRLNVIDIHLPPLRERKSDIPLLVNHFLEKYNNKNKQLTPEAKALLLTYDFPGNIRELENAIQRAIALSQGDLIESFHLPESIAGNEQTSSKIAFDFSLAEIKRQAAEKAEKEMVTECLRTTKGHLSNAAKMLNMNVANFQKIVKKYKINSAIFKESRQ